jgi:hypothetical protein
MKNTLLLNEGSYQYAVIETDLNITEDFILMKLSKQFEYRPTNETLWASLITETERTIYTLDYPNRKLI